MTDTTIPSRAWAPIRRGRNAGTVVAWIEVFWSAALERYVIIPGASRFHQGPDRPDQAGRRERADAEHPARAPISHRLALQELTSQGNRAVSTRPGRAQGEPR
jgi:hypothetical protein